MILCTFLISIKSLNPNIFNGFQAFSFLKVSKTGLYNLFYTIILSCQSSFKNKIPQHKLQILQYANNGVKRVFTLCKMWNNI